MESKPRVLQWREINDGENFRTDQNRMKRKKNDKRLCSHWLGLLVPQRQTHRRNVLFTYTHSSTALTVSETMAVLHLLLISTVQRRLVFSFFVTFNIVYMMQPRRPVAHFDLGPDKHKHIHNLLVVFFFSISRKTFCGRSLPYKCYRNAL